ncbi:MAG: GxxExxY protein [Gemmatimonadaceae bacterium]|nr:GxxExxY protein [Gemmatimonadaceae bacterium]
MVHLTDLEVRDLARMSGIVVDSALRLHRDLGPGLLESVYETLLARALQKQGLDVQRQVPIRFSYDGADFPVGFRADILVGHQLLVEVKSVEQTLKSHVKQVVTYVRLANLPAGLLLNFGAPLLRLGMKRIANHPPLTGTRLPTHFGATQPVEVDGVQYLHGTGHG